jgi:hypothetical protein
MPRAYIVYVIMYACSVSIGKYIRCENILIMPWATTYLDILPRLDPYNYQPALEYIAAGENTTH